MIVALGVLIYTNHFEEEQRRKYYEALNQQIREEQRAEEAKKEAEKEAEKARVAEILDRIPGIVCWGDSLTSGAGGGGIRYPNVVADLLKYNEYITTTVVNMGVGGENTKGIMSRAGALDIVLTESVVIPEKCEAVQVKYSASDGSKISLLRQGNGGASNVSIAGIEGTLSIQQESYTSAEYSYWFTRAHEGAEISVDAGTQIINDGSLLYTDYVPVLFMGQNGGWDNDPLRLIEQQQAILDTCGKNKEHFIIVGLTTGSAESRAELETAMQEHWGEHYINLREMLCDEKLLGEYGVTCSDSDLQMIANGEVPDAIRVDDVHFNATGYTIIGNVVFNRLVELRYVEK